VSKNLSIQVDTLDREGTPLHRGVLDRSQGIVDPKTRLTNFVARIDHCFANPFSKSPIPSPLSLGQFVNLQLTGRKTDAFVLPDSAFRDLTTVLVVDKENTLHSRQVRVLHRTNRKVWVGKGLKTGDRVCITPIEIISEGMKVRVVGDEEPASLPVQPGTSSETNGSK